MTDLELAEHAARLAADLLMVRFGGPARGVDLKSSRSDLVSDADREAEAAVSDLLARDRPDDGLLGEEGSSREATSGRRWVVDPLDGTTNYLHGVPTWCVSVALEDEGGGLAGVVHDPNRGETFTAARGEGTRLNGRPVHVGDADRLEAALVVTGFSYSIAVRERQVRTLAQVVARVRDVRRTGSAALDLAWVAAGRYDGYYERGAQHWDLAAGMLLVTEAGGAFAPLDGDPPGLVATTQPLLPALAQLVAG